MNDCARNFFTRGSRYGVVGVGTYLFDLSVVYALSTYTSIPLFSAIFIGFIIGVSINYSISYRWAFAGTEQRPVRGYIYFILIALATGASIAYATTYFINTFFIPLVFARTLIASIVGLLNFILNARFNFRVL